MFTNLEEKMILLGLLAIVIVQDIGGTAAKCERNINVLSSFAAAMELDKMPLLLRLMPLWFEVRSHFGPSWRGERQFQIPHRSQAKQALDGFTSI